MLPSAAHRVVMLWRPYGLMTGLNDTRKSSLAPLCLTLSRCHVTFWLHVGQMWCTDVSFSKGAIFLIQVGSQHKGIRFYKKYGFWASLDLNLEDSENWKLVSDNHRLEPNEWFSTNTTSAMPLAVMWAVIRLFHPSPRSSWLSSFLIIGDMGDVETGNGRHVVPIFCFSISISGESWDGFFLF